MRRRGGGCHAAGREHCRHGSDRRHRRCKPVPRPSMKIPPGCSHFYSLIVVSCVFINWLRLMHGLRSAGTRPAGLLCLLAACGDAGAVGGDPGLPRPRGGSQTARGVAGQRGRLPVRGGGGHIVAPHALACGRVRLVRGRRGDGRAWRGRLRGARRSGGTGCRCAGSAAGQRQAREDSRSQHHTAGGPVRSPSGITSLGGGCCCPGNCVPRARGYCNVGTGMRAGALQSGDRIIRHETGIKERPARPMAGAGRAVIAARCRAGASSRRPAGHRLSGLRVPAGDGLIAPGDSPGAGG